MFAIPGYCFYIPLLRYAADSCVMTIRYVVRAIAGNRNIRWCIQARGHCKIAVAGKFGFPITSHGCYYMR